ncbi:hypothetical protein THRCLA_11194 [Thraustotheca clavata]|uniref:START domain-containing protein n=1 Tax=Thraustotheca clavata TaxID=74557 RepID=A0A1V9Y8M2_9STRA|nr:hypothetical protein THRCLA_11194 [Thraustotheca clavata]
MALPDLAPCDWHDPVLELDAVLANTMEYEEKSIAMLLGRVDGFGIHQWNIGPAKEGIQVHYGDVKGSAWPAMKTNGLVHASPERLVEVLQPADAASKLDKFTKTAIVLDTLSTSMELRYFETIGVLFVAPRDFCAATIRQELPDGRIVIASRSIITKDCPKKNGYVRAQALLSGYVITPIANDPNTCSVCVFGHVDFGGSIPGSIVKMVGLSAPIKIFQNLRCLAMQTR